MPTFVFGSADLVRIVPDITCGGKPLSGELSDRIDRVVVDTHRHRPDMFEISFVDQDLTVAASAALRIGTAVTIGSASAADDTPSDLVSGEITAVEGSYGRLRRTVVRGYSLDHRLQRGTRNRTFLNVKDSALASKIAEEYHLPIGTVDQTRTVHRHIGQVNQTDWEFLRSRAAEIGFDVGIVAGRFCFTKPVDVRNAKTAGLAYPSTLRSFEPRITAGNLVADTEVRVWDPAARRAGNAIVATSTTSTHLAGTDPAALTRTFRPTTGPPPAKPDPTIGELGPAASAHAQALTTLPVATGSGIDGAAREAATGAAQRLAGTVVEAYGEAVGNPALLAGRTVQITGVGTTFEGRWLLTRAVHTFGVSGYLTRFEVSGSQERSVLGLAALGTRTADRGIPGLVCGVVGNINDPDKQGRVQVILPWLSPSYVTDWAPVAHAGAGNTTAALFLPEVGDEVLVGFEFGDPRRPYVLGGITTAKAKHDLGGPPVATSGGTAAVVWRGIVSPNGNRLAFHDERTPGSSPTPTKGEIVLGTAKGDVAIVIDQVKGTLKLVCKNGGRIDVQAGKGAQVTIGGGADLSLTAEKSIKIESKGPVEIKGNPIKLN
ncbi:phage baseplate assembly protein V [Amycolatopsis sp. NPDC049252]|uniref:phage baseplate assembly protein V n=1 Tax=Amycolatopsis sp. NPDC049252 TaxID=3363933 RepID=UPI00372436A8